MSSPKFFSMIADTFLIASFAISPNFPVAIISDFFEFEKELSELKASNKTPETDNNK